MDWDKIVSALVRSLTGLIIGAGGYQFWDGSTYGQMILAAYLQQRQTEVLTSPGTSALYSEFATASIPTSLQGVGLFWLALSAALLLGLLAHVVGKPNVVALRKTLTLPVESIRMPRRVSDLSAIGERIVYEYCRHQELFTIGLFALLGLAFAGWPFASGLAIGFLLLSVPAATYLLLYAKDISVGAFGDRFTLIATGFILIISLVAWPLAYGRRTFDPSFALTTPTDEDQCDKNKLLTGPAFVAFETDKEHILFRICYDQTGTKYLDFYKSSGRIPKIGRQRLSLALDALIVSTAQEGGGR